MAIIDSIINKLGEIIYPKTVTKAVYDADNQKRLDGILNEKQDSLTAGDNVDITNNTISATDTIVDISGKADKTYVDDKVKTDVPTGAKFTDTVYTHPASHPASMITESSTKRFVSDTKISEWDGKETTTGSQDKADTAEQNAKNYTDNELSSFEGMSTHGNEYHTENYATQLEVTTHIQENITTHGVSRGVSSFVGNNAEVTIPHGLDVKPTSAYAFPTENSEGFLGEVWIRIDETNIYVGNSGSFAGAMSWTAIK